MRRDSQGKTGEDTVLEMSKEMLLVAYDNKDIEEDYKRLKKRLGDPNTTNRDFATLLRLAWDFRLPKPERALDVTSGGEKISSGVIIDWEDDEGIQAT